MARILLNIDVNNAKALNEIKEITDALNKMNSAQNGKSGNGGARTAKADVDGLQKSYANLLNTIRNTKSLFSKGVFDETEKSVRANFQAIKELNAEVKENGKITASQKKEIKSYAQSFKELSATFATIRAEEEKLNKETVEIVPNIDTVRKALYTLMNQIKSAEGNYAKGTFGGVQKDLEGLIGELDSLSADSPQYAETINRISATLKQLGAAFAKAKAEGTNLHGGLTDIVSGFLKFQAAAMIVMTVINSLRNAWSSLNDTLVKTEKTVIEIRRVLSETVDSNTISGSLYKLAQEYGQTFENVSEIATNFARAGMSWADTIEATRAALLALNVAELNSEEASNGLIAVMSQFKIEAADLTDVIDKLNKTADNFPVTTEKLLKALQRTGSAAVNANLSLDETVGLITALSKATGRSGENLGTALNSLINYSTKSGSLDVFASLSENTAAVVDRYRKGAADILEVWQAVSQVIQNMNAEQEKLLNGLISSDDIQNLETELQDELGDIFETVQDVYGTANTFRKNYFIALLGNMDSVLKAMETAQDAAGYSAKENEQYLDTYEAKLNSLTAQWQYLANDEQGILEFKKSLLDVASGVLDLIKLTGGLRTTFAALATIIAAAFGQKIVDAVGSFIKSLRTVKTEADAASISLNGVLGIIGLIITAISAVVGAVENAERAAKEARQAAIDSYNAHKENAIQLEAYYKALQEATPQSEEYYKIEKELTALLGEKAGYLKDLVEGTKDYSEAVAKLTLTELTKLRLEKETAMKAAAVDIEKLEPNQPYTYEDRDKVLRAAAISGAQAAALNKYLPSISTSTSQSKVWTREGDQEIRTLYEANWGWDASGGIEAGLKNYERAVEILDSLAQATTQARLAGDEEAEAALNLLFDTFNKIVEGNKKSVETYKDALNWEKLIDETLVKLYEDANEGAEEHEKTLEDVKDKYKDIVAALKAYKEELDDAEKLAEKQNAVLEAQQALEEAIAEARKKDIIAALEQERNTKAETLSLEEKQLEVEKARIALENAQRDRTVRVYNSQTGTWEWQANAKNVQTAQENYNKAKNSLDSYIENAAWDEVINGIKSGDLDGAGVAAIVSKWSAFSTESSPAWAATIRNTFNNATANWKLNPDSVKSAQEKLLSAQESLNKYLKEEAWDDLYSKFQSGNAVSEEEIRALLQGYVEAGYFTPEEADTLLGIISAAAGITRSSGTPAASSGNTKESTAREKNFANTPYVDFSTMSGREIMDYLASWELPAWQSNTDAYSGFVNDLGLLFGAYNKQPTSGKIITTHGNVYDNSNSNNVTYAINGVEISKADAETHTLFEIFDAMGLVPTK